MHFVDPSKKEHLPLKATNHEQLDWCLCDLRFSVRGPTLATFHMPVSFTAGFLHLRGSMCRQTSRNVQLAGLGMGLLHNTLSLLRPNGRSVVGCQPPSKQPIFEAAATYTII